MANYVRQSAADIVDGEDIVAAPLNAEFNQLQAAFHATTGHPHDGGAGNGPKISLTTSISGVLPVANGGVAGIHKVNGTTAPTANDDSGDGYAVGSLWIDTTNDQAYICVDSTLASAVWEQIDNTGDLAAIEALSTTGILARTGTNTWATRTITGTASEITVTNGDGVSGNPTLSFPSSMTFAGKTIADLGTVTTADINGGTVDGAVIGGSSAAAGTFTNLTVNTALLPDADGGANLGSTTLGWPVLHLSSGATINAANGNAVVTHSSGIWTVSTGDLRVTTAGTNAASVVTVGGTQTLTNKTLTSPILGTSPTAAGATWTNLGTVTTADINGGTVDGAIIGGSSAAAGTFTILTVNTYAIPDTDDGASLGITTNNWSDLYLASGATINAANGNAVITHSSGIWTVSTGDLRVTTAGTNSASVVTVGGTQTLTNKTLTSPVLNTGVSGTAVADVADYEAFSSTSLLVTPGRMRYHPGVAKASVSWTPTGTMGDPYNVGSITDTGTGDWTVNIIDDFSGSDWTGVVTATHGTTITVMLNTQAAGTSRVIALNSAAAFVDPTMMHFIALGDF